jgi:hypothetical protein
MHKGSENDGDPTVLKPVEARQGLLGRPVLVVLIVSTILAVIAMFLTGFIRIG